jgi:GLPGLI family protein
MNKIYLFNLVITFIITNSCYSQDNYQVKYKMTTLFDGLKNYEAKLTFSEQKSCFEYKLFANDTTTTERKDVTGNITIVIPNKRTQSIIVNLKEQKVKELKYLKSTYLVEDKLSIPQWDITNEIKTINNHQCQKATTAYKGRTYEAWYASEYPTIFGPWKLNGLPGLIILAHDRENEVFFEATKIQKIDKNTCQEYNSIKHISKVKFVQLMNKTLNNLEERLKSMGNRNLKFDVKFAKAVDIEILD